MRLGYDLASEKLCEVPPHTNVEVLEVRQGDGANGRMRARLRSSCSRAGWFSQGYKEGWVTTVLDDGTHLLVAPNPESTQLVPPTRLPPPAPGVAADFTA